MRIISWNMQRGRGLDGQCDAARALAQLREASEFDVLCLQEVSCGYHDLPGLEGVDQFAQLRDLLPGFTGVDGIVTDRHADRHPRQQFGNMLFSRFPLLQIARHTLPWPPDPEVDSMQRGVIEAVLDTPIGVLRVSTTHLEYFSASQRSAQVERLRELHHDSALRPAPAQSPRLSDGPFSAPAAARLALLAGDCNFQPHEPEYRRLTAPFGDAVPPYCDAWNLRYPGQPTPATVCVHAVDTVPFTYDYIFATPQLQSHIHSMRVLPLHTGSDHQPVLIELGNAS
ncbi:endonuclease/exonuclease/phosphatase family protein [Massilia sp. CF038]|uniref:endonuclease/exonuclease/phosphatase family protein n=1 Tax=Massilia sp. CF038 TaxID=1881045 RepID=UPI0009220FDA|nr:endonuclease/exonuclease/phosphatase family protein [Massilia sp. CF038]SHG73101.1 Metal-dependent hydrolase, endonuclease/exonuclease/phosphatase family [Massilia sp. CF038]